MPLPRSSAPGLIATMEQKPSACRSRTGYWSRRGAQWDDMAGLQTAVADDDALDDELQDRLLVGKRRFVQAGVNAITKRLQAGANGLGLDALATEVIALLLLALQGQALVSQMVAPLRQLGQGHRAGLVGVQ